MAPLVALAAMALSLVGPARAQSDTVVAAVVVSTFGDRVPLLSPDYSVITSLGASQMFAAGQALRSRYISPTSGGASANTTDGNYTIAGISTDRLEPSQVAGYATSDVWIAQSIQALMDGLYPPVGANASGSTLANGSAVAAPLDGAQFPLLSLVTQNDPAYTYVSGHSQCARLTQSRRSWAGTADYTALSGASQAFYGSLGAALSGAAPQYYAANFASAYAIWEFLAYQAQHGASVMANASTVGYARSLADVSVWNQYGNMSADGGLRPLAGRTLLGQVIEALWLNAQTDGSAAKLTAYVTDVQPMLGLFSVLGLPDHDSNFTRLPDPASSLVFELFATGPAGGNATQYPDTSDLRVRVLFRNGTGDDDSAAYTTAGAAYTQLPVLGRGDEPSILSLLDFTSAASQVAVPDPSDWCFACDGSAIYCAYLTNGTVGLPPGASSLASSSGSSGSGQGSGQAVSPPVAGVIGAVVTLAVLGLLGAALLLGGFRLRKEQRGKRRSSQLGGFKGAEKLAR